MSADPATALSGRRGLPFAGQQLVQVRRRCRRDSPEHLLQPLRRIQPGLPRRDQQAVDHRAPRSRPGMPRGTTRSSSHAGLRIRNRMPGPAASPGNMEWNAPSPTADGHGPCRTRTHCRTTNACALDKAKSARDEFACPRALKASAPACCCDASQSTNGALGRISSRRKFLARAPASFFGGRVRDPRPADDPPGPHLRWCHGVEMRRGRTRRRGPRRLRISPHPVV